VLGTDRDVIHNPEARAWKRSEATRARRSPEGAPKARGGVVVPSAVEGVRSEVVSWCASLSGGSVSWADFPWGSGWDRVRVSGGRVHRAVSVLAGVVAATCAAGSRDWSGRLWCCCWPGPALATCAARAVPGRRGDRRVAAAGRVRRWRGAQHEPCRVGGVIAAVRLAAPARDPEAR